MSITKSRKRIAIIGGGTGGLGTLKAILDLPEEVRRDWIIDLYEQRNGIGGIWLPEDPDIPTTDPDQLPETPVYPTLKLNTVHPTITFPRFPFPKGTPLLPHYSVLAKYHTDFATKFNLWPHVHVSSRIVSAEYGNDGWSIGIEQENQVNQHRYDHLIVAHGHNHYPKEPQWSGRELWLKNPNHRIQHSRWYRDPQDYAGQTVVVVGFGASGWDITRQVIPFAEKVYHSFERDPKRPTAIPPVQGAIQLGLIFNLDEEGLIMADGTIIPTPPNTTIMLATGYQLKTPFLGLITVDTTYKTPSTIPQRRLTNNLALIRPLHRQIFAIDERIPRNALSFVGLPVPIANGPSSYAQGLYAAHGIADESWLPSKDEMLTQLEAYEQSYRDRGFEPLEIGHRFVGEGVADDYQDQLIHEIETRSSIPLPGFLQTGKPYIEPWRRWARLPSNFIVLNQAWQKLESLGLSEGLVKDVETEAEWAAVLEQVLEWGKSQAQQSQILLPSEKSVQSSTVLPETTAQGITVQ